MFAQLDYQRLAGLGTTAVPRILTDSILANPYFFPTDSRTQRAL